MDGVQLEEDWVGLPASLAGISLLDAPILFFVASHKAFRSELCSLRRAAEEAVGDGGCSRELVVDLCQKFEFFQLVYNYHCAAEDEVVFLALDERVKNVMSTYSLEHISIDEKFTAIFHLLDILIKKDEGTPQMFQELLFSLSTVQAMIYQHMQKEEQQVFPLLKQKFTSGEQAQLVWQYMCSVPVVLLQEFLPWMLVHLSPDEKLQVVDCVKVVMQKETLLQEVVVSWFQHKDGSSSTPGNMYEKGYRFLNELHRTKDMLELYPYQKLNLGDACPVETSGVDFPINGIYDWHAAVRRDFNQIIEELHQIRSSSMFTMLPSVIVQIKFAADVLIFYSNSLDKIFYPLLSVLAKGSLSPCRQLIDESQIEGLRKLLLYELSSAQLRRFVDMLSSELESLVDGFDERLVYLEKEVFTFLSENCSREMQLWLLYTSLHIMPLGLLMGIINWFSSHLSEAQSNSILKNVMLGCPLISESFTSLLYEWVRVGSSGKTSVAKFRQNLQEMFNCRSYYLTENICQSTAFSDERLEPNSDLKMNITVDMPSSSVPVTTEVRDTLYSSGMNLHLLFPCMLKTLSPAQKQPVEPGHTIFLSLESRPMDHIFLIHRAFIKDLEYLVSLSAKLTTNVEFLAEFISRFNLLHNMYQIHSTSEDEIAFPALETKETLQNISHSYIIDHKLEVKQFTKIFKILNNISNFHDVCSNETRLFDNHLCLKLHESCLSLHRILSDHIYREEVEIFSRFRGCFSMEEEEKIVGHMLGRIKAEVLLEMIPWLMGNLTVDEQKAMISLWRKVTRNTKFDEWLDEWWEGRTRFVVPLVKERSRPSPWLSSDPLEVVALYLLKEGNQIQKNGHDGGTQKEMSFETFEQSGSCNVGEAKMGGQEECQSQNTIKYWNEVDKKKCNETYDGCQDDKTKITIKESQTLSHQDDPLGMNQEELETIIRRVSRDSTLGSQNKSHIIQNLLTSRWMVTQKISREDAEPNNEGEITGLCPSYRDPLKVTFGCKHYKRNCKIYAPCCEKLYTCTRCHDDLMQDHVIDRKVITKMMCMKCLKIQPIGPKCMTSSCGCFSMARYYCKICKLFDDERQIYHCPYCNICRVGKGLGVDYFHCMKCNACMSRSLFVHACREKCLEDNCPICHEFIFTSSSPVKGLPCGHLMHSTCFQDYTCSHYICPICSKSLGDMQVYFGMLDALLAEEKIPEEYASQTQVILCNDCEKKGSASFHWLYHKCSHCGSYNTRLM